MKKTTLLTLIALILTSIGHSQSNRFWISHNPNERIINKDKAAERLSFPKDFKFPKNMANSHCYKQAGNSVVVPLIQKVSEEIYKIIK